MVPIRAIPLIPSIVVGLMLALLTWASVRGRGKNENDTLMRSHDGAILGLITLAVFAVATFLVYVLLGSLL